MVTFVVLYTIYFIEHLYLFLKLNSVFPMGTGAGILTGLFLLFMTFSPVVIHLYCLRGNPTLARIFAHAGFLWMALILFFFPLAILLDLYNILIQLGGVLMGQELNTFLLSSSASFYLPVFLSIVFCLYGYSEARNLRLERLTIKTKKTFKGANRLTIVHISDLHLGLLLREKPLERVMEKIRALSPDLIVSTGDLVDGEIKHIDHLTDRLKELTPRLGKFAVPGNHEFLAGIDHSTEFLERAGFILLRNQGITVDGILNIAGIDDPVGMKRSSEREILSGLPSDRFTLLLKHRPEINEDSLGLFDLQLSGHTHKGQLFPVNLITRFLFNPHAGFKELSRGSAIYVSRGAGTACAPIRFLSPPEITFIELIHRT